MREYLPNACLLTDFYQFTMAQAYFDQGRENSDAVFHLFFRKNPFKGNWALAAGISDALDYVSCFKFDSSSIDYLASVTASNGTRIFRDDFLASLEKTSINIDIFGVKDGEIVFPFEPILRVQGPIFLCQLLETPILNIVNFQTLIATKAARMVLAANKKTVVDFGLRRAQGFDGAISATKAAYIGGVDATSNVWAAKHFGIPPTGTQAHSFIMSYQHQTEAFRDFAESFKHNCVLVVDTYDPILGINDAIKTYLALRKKGHEPLGIRLDSGDLLHLSKVARNLLNRAGFQDCKIIVSGDLDEHEILRLEASNAPIDIYGVGTNLITAHDDPALGGVFKLAAIKDKGVWRDTYKESATKAKESRPGRQAIVRYFLDGECRLDHIFDPNLGRTPLPFNTKSSHVETLLHEHLMEKGIAVGQTMSLEEMRKKAAHSINGLPDSIRSLVRANPPYRVYIDDTLAKKKLEVIAKLAEDQHSESAPIN